METDARGRVGRDFLVALLWVSGFVAVSTGIMLITELILVDFVHGNPNRTKENVIFMMGFFAPLLMTVSVFGVLWVFFLAQIGSIIFGKFLIGFFNGNGIYAAAFLVPLTAIVSWYFFDYLTPPNLSINEGPEGPFQHGLTTQRYLAMLGIQGSITLFTLLYFGLGSQRITRLRTH